MKKSVNIGKVVTSLAAILLVIACTKNELEDSYGAQDSKEIPETEIASSTARGVPQFGDTRSLVRGNSLPFDWYYVTLADQFFNSRTIVYVGGANFGNELTIAKGQNLPFGWVTKYNSGDPNVNRIVYLEGFDIPFDTKKTVAGGQSLPFNWVYDRAGNLNSGSPGRAVFLGNSFIGDETYALTNQQLPQGWEYQTYAPPGTAVKIRLISGAERPTPPIALFSGESLYPGQWRDSPNGRYRFVLQTDGNLVLYDIGNGGAWQALWHTNTWGTTAGRLIMQGDGNLVLYDGNNNALWDSGTWQYSGAQLSIQDDGNIVVYSQGNAVWHRLQG